MTNKKGIIAERIIVAMVIAVIIFGIDAKAEEPPDLVVSGITWNSANPAVGSSITFTVNINNQGGGNAPNTYIYYYVDGSKIGYNSIGGISSGGSITTNFNWNVQAGSHSIKAIIDPENKIVESNENNNEKLVSFEGIPSDLTVSGIVWSPTNPAVGSSVTFTVNIKNQGEGGALNSYVYYYVDGSKVGYNSVSSLSSGGSTATTFNWQVQAGNHSIKATIDPENKIAESNENNNDISISFTGTPSDLVVTDIVWSPTNPAVGSSVTFSVNIKNQGSGDALNTYVYYYVDGSKVGYNSISSLSSGGVTTTTFQWNVKMGSHTINAIVDPENKMTESDEDNNEKTVTFEGVPSDLIVSNIIWNSANPAVGSSVTFTANIRNQGAGDAIGSYIYYYIDGSKVGYDSVSGIIAGGSTTTDFNWNVQPGNHSIKAIIDPENKISESDESNNEKVIEVVGNPSDLIISDMSWNMAGSSVTFTVNIRNQGIGDALGSYIHYYIDGAKVGSDSISSIIARGSSTVTFRWTAKSGSHSAKAVVDPENKISESDDNNNEKSIDFDISLEPVSTPSRTTPRPTFTQRPTPEPTIQYYPRSVTPIATAITPMSTTSISDSSGKPSVSLTGEKTDVKLGDDIILKFSAVNIITRPKMYTQVIIIPPSGMSVVSTEFVKSGMNQYTANYELEPGESKGVGINVRPNQIGDFIIKGRIIYYFGNDKDKADDYTKEQPIKVRNEIPPSPGPTPDVPGFVGNMAIFGILLAVLSAKYRSIKRRTF